MGGSQPPEFLSDHPSHEARIVALRKWLPEAELRSEQSDCHRTLDFLQAFGQSWGYDPRNMKRKDSGFEDGPVVGFNGMPENGERLVRTDEAVRRAYDNFESGSGEKKGRR